ncbi:MAG: biosynthetic-type acetolactate synthase large subunit [Desulfobulbus sp.]|nr:biosynthetic-type acetolactate synthase large subunit [Desulfobulbus sp.]
MPIMNGAEIIIHQLERHGITVVAGIPGGANLPLYDALAASTTIRHVLARHEQGAGFIAQGMARATGRPAVCFATSGPGATNVLTALADAAMDSVPMVCITGQVARPLLGTSAFQEVDICAMVRPAVKAVFAVHEAGELAATVAEALHLAGSGRPGPVLVDVPKDVQLERVSCGDWPDPPAAVDRKPLPIEALEAAVDLIDRAERPMLYLGGGVVRADGADAARRLAERGDMPAVMTLMGLGTLPADHPLSLGLLGMHGARATNLAMAECDLLIAVGARFDDRATGLASAFCPLARVIHTDIDPREMGRLRGVEVALVGDGRRVLEKLAERIRPQRRPAWQERIRQLEAAHGPCRTDGAVPEGPARLIRRVAELVGPDALITTDVGKHQMWVAQAYPFSRPGQLLTSGGLGTMGFGLPAAIGAALACPGRRAVCFSGDGSLQMNIQELATAVEQQLDLTIVLLNNQSLGLVRQQQRLFYEARCFASAYPLAVDFAAIARGFGMRAQDLSGAEQTADEVLAWALREPGPCLVNVPIDIDAEVAPMVPPGAANTLMIGGEENGPGAQREPQPVAAVC